MQGCAGTRPGHSLGRLMAATSTLQASMPAHGLTPLARWRRHLVASSDARAIFEDRHSTRQAPQRIHQARPNRIPPGPHAALLMWTVLRQLSKQQPVNFCGGGSCCQGLQEALESSLHCSSLLHARADSPNISFCITWLCFCFPTRRKHAVPLAKSHTAFQAQRSAACARKLADAPARHPAWPRRPCCATRRPCPGTTCTQTRRWRRTAPPPPA